MKPLASEAVDEVLVHRQFHHLLVCELVHRRDVVQDGLNDVGGVHSPTQPRGEFSGFLAHFHHHPATPLGLQESLPGSSVLGVSDLAHGTKGRAASGGTQTLAHAYAHARAYAREGLFLALQRRFRVARPAHATPFKVGTSSVVLDDEERGVSHGVTLVLGAHYPEAA